MNQTTDRSELHSLNIELLVTWACFFLVAGVTPHSPPGRIVSFYWGPRIWPSPMTVTYTARVANARFCGFSKLLLAWRGSIYKVLYKEFLAFFAMYAAISITYRWDGDQSFLNHCRLLCGRFALQTASLSFRFLLFDDQKRYFEKLAIYCNHYASLIPMSFVLGKRTFLFLFPRRKKHNLQHFFRKDCTSSRLQTPPYIFQFVLFIIWYCLTCPCFISVLMFLVYL